MASATIFFFFSSRDSCGINDFFFPNIYLAVDKVQALKRYKFSLAFENSNEEDYVTEKFFQSLVAGMKTIFLPTCLSQYLLLFA